MEYEKTVCLAPVSITLKNLSIFSKKDYTSAMTIPIPTPLNIETIASNTILIVKDDIHTAMVYPAKALLGASHLHFPDASLSTLKTLLLCNQAFALYIAKIHNIVPLMTIAEYEHDRTSSKNMLFHCLQ